MRSDVQICNTWWFLLICRSLDGFRVMRLKLCFSVVSMSITIWSLFECRLLVYHLLAFELVLLVVANALPCCAITCFCFFSAYTLSFPALFCTEIYILKQSFDAFILETSRKRIHSYEVRCNLYVISFYV